MSDDLSRVRLVLPIGPGTPLVEIDGQAIKGVMAAQVDHNHQAGTVVHIALMAELSCETAPEPEDDEDNSTPEPADEWEDMGTLGDAIYQRNKLTGEQRKVPRVEAERHKPLK